MLFLSIVALLLVSIPPLFFTVVLSLIPILSLLSVVSLLDSSLALVLELLLVLESLPSPVEPATPINKNIAINQIHGLLYIGFLFFAPQFGQDLVLAAISLVHVLHFIIFAIISPP